MATLLLGDVDWSAPRGLVYAWQAIARWPDEKTFAWVATGTESEMIREGLYHQLCGAVSCEFYRFDTLGPDDEEAW